MTAARKPARAVARAPEGPQQLVVFSLHGEAYGLPIACVREIVRYTEPRATAAASGMIQGLINLREQVFPVVDLSVRLGRTPAITPHSRILIVEVGDAAVGLVVDTVEGVREVRPEQLEPLPEAMAGNGLGERIAALGERLILVIDPDRALGSAVTGARKPRS